jgi:hypothetical protein
MAMGWLLSSRPDECKKIRRRLFHRAAEFLDFSPDFANLCSSGHMPAQRCWSSHWLMPIRWVAPLLAARRMQKDPSPPVPRGCGVS